MVNESTRSDNILDLIITSNEEFIDNLKVKESFSTSDHRIIRFNVNVGSIYEDNVKKEFKEVLYKLREESIPIMKRRNTKQKWVTKEVIKCRRAKEKSSKIYKKSG